jgi:hypothetical protein
LTVPEQLVQGAEPTITGSEDTVPHPLQSLDTTAEPHPVLHPELQPELHAGAGAGAQLETAAPEHFETRRIPPPPQSFATAPPQAAFFE